MRQEESLRVFDARDVSRIIKIPDKITNMEKQFL